MHIKEGIKMMQHMVPFALSWWTHLLVVRRNINYLTGFKMSLHPGASTPVVFPVGLAPTCTNESRSCTCTSPAPQQSCLQGPWPRKWRSPPFSVKCLQIVFGALALSSMLVQEYRDPKEGKV